MRHGRSGARARMEHRGRDKLKLASHAHVLNSTPRLLSPCPATRVLQSVVQDRGLGNFEFGSVRTLYNAMNTYDLVQPEAATA